MTSCNLCCANVLPYNVPCLWQRSRRRTITDWNCGKAKRVRFFAGEAHAVSTQRPVGSCPGIATLSSAPHTPTRPRFELMEHRQRSRVTGRTSKWLKDLQFRTTISEWSTCYPITRLVGNSAFRCSAKRQPCVS